MTKPMHAAALVVALSATPALTEKIWTAGPFDMPESAIFDAEHDKFIISQIGGDPGAADGNGALALVSREGEILDPAWVTGLDAPKGMAIIGKMLLVADLTQLRVINRSTGDIVVNRTGPGATFLNDVTSDGSVAYVSDMMTNSIWRYRDGAFTLWMQDDALNHPNGLLLDGERLLVGSWGRGMRADFSTTTPGSLLAVDMDTRAVSVIAAEIGNIDGVARIGDALLVNDWITGHLLEVTEAGAASVVGQYAPGLADISAHETMLLLPSMLEGEVSLRIWP